MKKLSICLLIVFAVSLMFAQRKANVRAGFLTPKDSKTGFIGGFSYGSEIDETVSLDFGMDIFYKGFDEKREIQTDSTEAGNDVTTIKKTADLTTLYFPVQGNVKVRLPLDSEVKPYFKAGLGWGFLWEDVFVAKTEENEKIDDVKFYNGFNWNLSLGVDYPLGSKSKIFGEFFYNAGKMKRNKEETEYGITWDEIDVSGIGLRFGIDFELR